MRVQASELATAERFGDSCVALHRADDRSARMSKWLREVGEDDADRVIAYTLDCRVVPLDTPIALLAAERHRRFELAPADAIV